MWTEGTGMLLSANFSDIVLFTSSAILWASFTDEKIVYDPEDMCMRIKYDLSQVWIL